MPRMNLTTFLANDMADSVTQANKLAKYAETPGGQDYYWAFKQGAKRMVLGEEPFDKAVGVMANMTVDHQRQGNQAALLALHEWRLKKPGLAIAPPVGEIAGPLGVLKVKLEPTWAIQLKSGQVEAYVPWTYQDLRLPPSVAGMGIFLLEMGFQDEPYAGWKFYIIDMISKKRFGHSSINKSTARAVNAALQTQEALYLAAKEAA